MKAPIVLTAGDPAGIGTEITLKAWNRLRADIPFFLLADCDKIKVDAESLGLPLVRIKEPHDALHAIQHGLPVLHQPMPTNARPGTPDPANAPFVVSMIKHAVELVQSGAASAMTTNPINKKSLYEGAGFAFPGHTEFLAHLSNAPNPVMMLCSPELRVVPVTIHIPLKDVPDALTSDQLESTIRTTHKALQDDFALPEPRLAVAGLNPHAGEGGKMGTEELELIIPVLERLRAEGITLIGPLSADTMFHPAARAKYDAAICMYHDQALIPIKTLNFSGGVNTTLGLPFVRSSPDHGTAYDIAGQNKANPTSLIAAIKLASELADQRA